MSNRSTEAGKAVELLLAVLLFGLGTGALIGSSLLASRVVTPLLPSGEGMLIVGSFLVLAALAALAALVNFRAVMAARLRGAREAWAIRRCVGASRPRVFALMLGESSAAVGLGSLLSLAVSLLLAIKGGPILALVSPGSTTTVQPWPIAVSLTACLSVALIALLLVATAAWVEAKRPIAETLGSG